MKWTLRASCAAAIGLVVSSYAAPSALAQQRDSNAEKRDRFVNMLLANANREAANSTVPMTRAESRTLAANEHSLRSNPGTVTQSRFVSTLSAKGNKDIKVEERIAATPRGSQPWGLGQRFLHLNNSLNVAIRLEPINPTIANLLGNEANSRFTVLYRDINTQIAQIQSKEASIEEQISILETITPQNPAQAAHIAQTIRLLEAQLRVLAGRESALSQLLTAATPVFPSV